MTGEGRGTDTPDGTRVDTHAAGLRASGGEPGLVPPKFTLGQRCPCRKSRP
jgi:hypothetical protein